MKQIAILGNGSWGTALALTLRETNQVTLWGALPDELEEIKKSGTNKKYLPDYTLEGIAVEPDIAKAAAENEILVSAIPTKFLRLTLKKAAPHITSRHIIVSVTKGIEEGSFKLISEILAEEIPACRGIVALSGPSHAEEVAQKMPTTVCAAAENEELALIVQKAFSTNMFRVYTNTDIIGVEIGGAIKNVIAIAAGISDGLGYGSNTLSALITRGLVEIQKFGKIFGAKEETFVGLSGLGDLITTCTSAFSRNHFVGEKIGKGMSLKEIEKEMVMVAEGVNTVKAVYHLGQEKNIVMPITTVVYKTLFENYNPKDAVADLMWRKLTAE